MPTRQAAGDARRLAATAATTGQHTRLDRGDPLDEPGALPVFVYGTLREGHENWAWALRNKTVASTPAQMPGARLVTGGPFPYLLPDSSGTVKGELMWLNPAQAHQVMDDLDMLEGYDPQNPDWSHYVRVRAHVHTDSGPVEAWVYIPAPNYERQLRGEVARGRLREVPDGDWNTQRL